MSSNQTLLDNTVLTFTPQFGSDSIQHLAVFETEPVVSLLDIFWESSTSGIVANLNSFIENEAGGSSAFGNWDTGDFCEDTVIGSSITNGSFYPVDSFGIQIPAANISSLVITQILDNQDPSVNVYQAPNPAFTLVDNLNGTYNITTNKVFARGVNANQNRSFTFYFELTTNDGAGSEITSSFTDTADVCNKLPLFGGSVSGGYRGLGTCPTTELSASTDNNDVIYKFYGRNGSVDNATQASNGDVYLDVTFELVSVINVSGDEIPNAFELSNFTTWNQSTGEPPSVELFRVSSFETFGDYSLVVDVIDADGARTTCQLIVEILAPGCRCFQYTITQGDKPKWINCDGDYMEGPTTDFETGAAPQYACVREWLGGGAGAFNTPFTVPQGETSIECNNNTCGE